jgi:hypothetical protein
MLTGGGDRTSSYSEAHVLTVTIHAYKDNMNLKKSALLRKHYNLFFCENFVGFTEYEKIYPKRDTLLTP